MPRTSPKEGPLGCLCIKCCDERRAKLKANDNLGWIMANTFANFRYACEICGNKRCPHHSDHTLACTNSNEPGQPGSYFK